MNVRSRRFTVRLEARVERWFRSEAKREGVSPSALLTAILKDRVEKESAEQRSNYERAMRRALSRHPFLKTDGH